MSSYRPALLSVVAVLAACSGSAAPNIGDGTDGGAEGGITPVDASTLPPDAASPDGSSVPDAGEPDAAGPEVHELPPPACNDLAQRADPVKTAGDPGPPPAAAPISTIAPGFYVVKEITDYGGNDPLQPGPTRTTVFFTATKEYYVRDDASTGVHQQLTLAWKITSGKLVRSIECTSASSTTSSPTYRIGSSSNGFTVFIDGLQPGNRTEAVRYEHAP